MRIANPIFCVAVAWFWLFAGRGFLGAEAAENAQARVVTEAVRLNRIVVTPNGPDDGGDFGPKTPDTKTSGLQEALDAAKAAGKDLYICGGSWTDGKTQPVVYVLHETLRVPWMQDFRLDGGHAVIHYAKTTGDAVVFDSQMSCYYRFGILVSVSDGAVVRLKPETAGPDRFKVITTTEFHFNALVGGGGAWPGGEAQKTELDPKRRWIGTGLLLDGSPGTINDNKISVVEIVGCDRGLHLAGASTNNWIDAPFIHLCNTHVQIGGPEDPRPAENRIAATMVSQGIPKSVGARIFGVQNRLELTSREMSPGGDLVFEPSAKENLVTAIRLPAGVTNRAAEPTNRVATVRPKGFAVPTPSVPPSGEEVVNRHPHPVEVRIVGPGKVSQWTQTDAQGNARDFPGLRAGQVFTLDCGEKVRFTYSDPPAWVWKGLP